MKEVNEKYMKKIYLNILKAILIVIYFFVLNLASENISAEHLERGIQLCTMIFLFMAIFIFEVAYKKDDDDLAIQGIEVLVLSAYTLTSQHITKKYNFNFKNYSLVASYFFAIYFIVKCIVIYTKGRKEMAEDYSDIKEIVKKDEPIKKEATKKQKVNSEDEKTKKVRKTKKENTKKNEEKAEVKKEPVKKRTTRKKVEKVEEKPENTEIKKEPAKKRTTRKKVEKVEEKPENTEIKKEPVKKRTTRKKVEKAEEKPENTEIKKEPAKKRTTRKKIETTKNDKKEQEK